MRVKRLSSVVVTGVLLCLMLLTGWGEESETSDSSTERFAAPIVVQRTPERGEALSVDGGIELIFDRAMDRASVEAAFSLSPSVEGVFEWADERTLRWKPLVPWARDAAYEIRLTTAAQDGEGRSIRAEYTFRFRTVGYLEVTQVIPAAGTEDTEADSTLTVMFNRPVVPLLAVSDTSINLPGPITIEPFIAGQGEWLNTSVYVFTPSVPLAGGTLYTARISEGLTDTTRAVLAEDYVWSFSTEPPQVTWVHPAAGADLVPVDTTIQVTFNMPVDLDSARLNFSFQSAGLFGQRVPGTFALEGNTLTFTAETQLDFDQEYAVSVEAGVSSAAGGSGMRKEHSWSFTTVPLPRIVATVPQDGERNAPPHTAFEIRFNTAIDPDTVLPNIEMEPPLPVEQPYTYFNEWNKTFVVVFDAQPSTDYVVHIGPNIADRYGNTTGQKMTVRFRTAPLAPTAWLHVPNRVGTYSAYEDARIFVAHRNTGRLELDLYRLSPKNYFEAQGDWYNFTPPADGRLRSWSVNSTAPLNELRYAPIDLVAGGGRLEPGIYFLELRADDVSYNRWRNGHILVVSQINLTLKIDERETLIWATDLNTGAPISGLDLQAFDSEGKPRGKATSDAAGLAVLPGSETLGRWYDITIVGTAPFTLGSSAWDEGISVWEFGFNPEGLRDWRAHIDTDRPLYRPEQTVHFRGIIRAEDDAHYTLLGTGSVAVTVSDANGELLYEQTLPLDEFGVFDGDVALPENAALGQYRISATLDEASFYGAFQVAEYRPPEFEVKVTPDQEEIAYGQANRATVDVGYFFGGAVADVSVEWRVLAEDYRFQPAQFGRYTFSDVDDPWVCWDCWWWQPHMESDVVLSGSDRTDAAGQLIIELPEEGAPASPGSRQLTVEATVRGNDGQTLSGHASIVVHRGEFYVGLSSQQSVGRAADDMNVAVLSVDWQGKRLPQQQLTYTVFRREWINTFVEENGGGRWEWEVNDVEVADGALATNDRAEGLLSFVPPQGGAYKVVVRGRDAGKRLVQSSLFVWVSGSETVSWRRSNDDRITLISDKAHYAPGETAEILIPSPFQGEQWALITVERGTVLQREVLLLESNSTVYRLPISADHVPNIYFSVVIVQGREAALAAATGAAAVASYKVGYVGLAVDPLPQTLHINLTPSVAQALPGTPVSYDVLVTNDAGEPTVAVLSLDVVDKAVLTLQPRVPNAIAQAFYARRGLGVSTAAGLAVSVNRLVLEQLEEIDDRGAVEATGALPPSSVKFTEKAVAQLPPGVELREEFADTAYWRARVVTAADGTAQVTVDLPDNLTTWVVRGVGITVTTQVGEVTVELLVTKPLLIRPVTPRFFVVGDRVQLAAIVNNNTDESRAVEVTVGYAGLVLEGEAAQFVDVPAGGERKVTWWVTVEDVPQVDVAFSAVSGEYSDAARPRLTSGPEGTLPVYRYTAPEIVGTGGQLLGEGSRVEVIALPPKYDDRRGELSLRFDPSLAAGMRAGLEYLEHFEYECTEQTISRFLPNVLTFRALRDLGIEDQPLEAKLSRLVEEGLDKLILQQHSDGGWGWWWDTDSNPYVSAYVVFALDKMQEAGFETPQSVLAHALDFLDASLVSPREFSSYREANRQAWLLYALAEAGRAGQVSTRTEELFEARAKLSHYARAYLALTLSLIDPGDSRIQTLLSDLQNAAILSATGAHWEEQHHDWWAMNTDTRSSAVILAALTQLDPGNALIPNVVRWLMIARKDGIWETTQETAWSLIALTDWMAVTGELQGQYDYSVSLNRTTLASVSVNPDNVQESTQLSVNIADLLADAGNRLTIERGPGTGRLYYTAHLKVYLPVEEIEPLDRGIIVQRQYVPADCADAVVCEELDSVAVGDIVQVRLNIIAPHDLHYVVIEDPLPAGGEAIDTSLATTSLLDSEPGLYDESPFYWWRWRWYSRSELRDEKVVLFAEYLPAGSYQYQYTFRATQPGQYRVIPTAAHEFYFPEVFGRGAGRLFTVTEVQTEQQAGESVIFQALLTTVGTAPPVVAETPHSAIGAAIFRLEYRLGGAVLDYSIAFKGLSDPATSIHFHHGILGEPGPIARTICATPTETAQSCSERSTATLNGAWKSADAQPFTPEMIAALLAGELYINIHTELNEAGEIRGQIVPLQ